MAESSPGSGCRYRAFISYSHADKAWADWLHKALETYRVPSRLVGSTTAAGVVPRRLNPVFRDREELASATDLGSKVNQALAQSANLIVVCSPAAAASRWVNEEVLAYTRLGHGDRIFCLIVAGEPNVAAGHEPEECFCPALRARCDGDGRASGGRTEPIAADTRPGKDGKTNAKLKLVAGMLDVGFDQLKQREQQRRLHRLTAITALALVVMAITAALAVFALASRDRAVVAQHQAEVARQAAERRQKQAEGLVGFMLGDLYDKLEQVDRLDIMQAVDDKAMAYFQSLPDTDVTGAALVQRAKALEKIGVVRMGLGKLAKAIESFRASVAISSRLASAAPADPARQTAYSRGLAFIGLAHWQQGNLDGARKYFESARRVLEASRADHDPSRLLQMSILDNDLGHVMEASGQPQAAASAYHDMLVDAQRAVAAKPGDTTYLQNAGDAHNNLGKLAVQRGDLATAITEYRTDDAIETRLVARDPSNNEQRVHMLTTRAILGRTLALTGDLDAGTRDLQQAVDAAERLQRLNPADTDIRDLAALYATQLSRLQRLAGHADVAAALIERAVKSLAALTAKDPGNSYWRSDYAAALLEKASQQRAAGRHQVARGVARKAATMLESMLARQPDDRDTLLATMRAQLLLASLATQPADARHLYTTALQTLTAAKTGRDDPRLLALQVEAMLALARKADAQPLLGRLRDEGYRDASFVAALRHARVAYPENPEFNARLLAAKARASSGAVASQAGNPPKP